MGSPINPKYPLFLRELNKNKVNNEENNIVGGGYPVVTVEDNFNIEAKPNTFYNIKNNADSDVNINLMDDYSSDKYLFFTCEENNEADGMVIMLGLIGGVIKSDTSISGYKYRMDIDLNLDNGESLKGSMFFDDTIKTGNTVNYLGVFNNLSKLTGKASNITVLNDKEDYLLEVNVNGLLLNNVLIYREYIEDANMFVYDVYGLLNLFTGISQLGTKVPYQEATEFFMSDDSILNDRFEVKVKNNKEEKIREIANEFIINVKSPANVTFNEEIKWNNNEEPDLTEEGIYTISILNGIGCYTFINN